MDVSKLYGKVEDAIKRKNYDYAVVTLKNQILKVNPNDVKARKLLRATMLEKYKAIGFPPLSQVWSKGLIPRIKMVIGKWLKKWDMVVDEAENFLEQDPKNCSALMALGEACVQANYMETAISVLESILSFDASYVDAFRALGEIYEKQGDLERAQQYYQRASQAAPNDIDSAKMVKDLAARITANTYGKATSSHQLIKDQERAKELEEDNAMLRTEEDYIRAIERIRKKLATDTNNRKELRRLGELLQKTGEFDEAMETYAQILEIDSTQNDIKIRISECKIQKAENIVQNFREKLKQSPENEALKQQLNKALKTKMETEAQEYAIQAKEQPTNYDIRFRLGTSLMQLARYDEALSHFQIAVNDPRRKAQVLTLMGQLFTQKKEFDLADEQFQNALKQTSPKDRQFKEILYYMALAHEAAGKTTAAIETFTTIYKEDINYRDVQARLKKLRG